MGLNGVGLDVSHHARISQRGGEKLFYLTSFFIGSVLAMLRFEGEYPNTHSGTLCAVVQHRVSGSILCPLG
jgi:hypothetical protein